MATTSLSPTPTPNLTFFLTPSLKPSLFPKFSAIPPSIPSKFPSFSLSTVNSRRPPPLSAAASTLNAAERSASGEIKLLLEVRDLTAVIAESRQQILNGVNLTVYEGEVHAIMGKNGSGKSTFSKVLVGHPEYEVTGGTVTFKVQNLLEMEPEERSLSEIFMSFQSPVEIPGVSNSEFLNMAYNARQRKLGLPELGVIEKDKIKPYWLGFDNNYESLWRHEWNVHGKCSGLDLKKYFEKGVELSMSLTEKIDDAFSKESIKHDPSNHYEAQDYLNAIFSFFNFQPEIRCVQYGGQRYLKEILFCYDVNLLQLINCPGNNAFSTDCGGPTSQIYFP